MSRSKRQGYEELDVDGVLFVFRANFGFLQSLMETTDRDAIALQESVVSGDPTSVRDVLVSGLISQGEKNLDLISTEEKQKIIEDLITKAGFQECWLYAQWLLNHAMIGDIKKKKIENNLNPHRVIEKLLSNSPWQNLKTHVILWVYVGLISITLQCTITKIYNEFFI